ncbi:unnamed protein product, partial [Aphanomyces euteiches]
GIGADVPASDASGRFPQVFEAQEHTKSTAKTQDRANQLYQPQPRGSSQLD